MSDPEIGHGLTYAANTADGRIVPVGQRPPTEPRAVAVHESRGVALARMHNYLVLAKPRIAVMVLLTVALGYALGATAQPAGECGRRF